MFKVIEPKYHCFYTSPINHFVELIKTRACCGFSQREQNQFTFILADDGEKDFDGGALLLKKKLKDFPAALVKVLSDFVSPKEEVWDCMVFFTFKKESPLYESDESGYVCQLFYRKLYDSLVEFGKKEGIGFLCISLDSEEYLCTEGLIFWPYVFELKPQDSSNGSFQGVLALRGSQYEAYQKVWQSLNLEISNTPPF